ncbi:MAG: VCBS repeat-containing protein, partial [Anaerolineales bacterium]|nr:VCBS repeat-containing protein [Anaerolineales bacterium]
MAIGGSIALLFLLVFVQAEARQTGPIAIAGHRPEPNAHDVPVDTTVVITLTAPISNATVTGQGILIDGSSQGRVTSTIGFDPLVLTPTVSFFPGEIVQTVVTTQVLALSGAPLAQPYVWTFQIEAAPADALFRHRHIVGANNSFSVAAGDLDGNGAVDIVIANHLGQGDEVWLNDGQGGFGAMPQQILGDNDSIDVKLGDVDGDGDLDVVFANWNLQPQTVWLNRGDGSFGAAPADEFGSGHTPTLALGDVDGDGDLDAVLGHKFENAEVWLNNGSGNFGTAAHDVFSSGDIRRLVMGDVDNDGDLDVVLVRYNNLSQQVWLNDGTGRFGAAPFHSFGG